MKKILRFIITIAIIIGIVFGVKYLVDNSGDNKYAYVKLLNAKATETICKSNIESGLDTLDNYLQDSTKLANVPDSVRASCEENGEFYCLRELVTENLAIKESYETEYMAGTSEQSLFTYFFNQMALITTYSKDSEQTVVSNYNSAVEQIDALKQSVASLNEFLNTVTAPNKSDFEAFFNKMLAEYKKTAIQISKLVYSMDTLVVQDHLNGNMVDISYIQKDVSALVIYAGLQTDGTIDFEQINTPLKNAKTLSSLTTQEQQELILAYNNISNLLGYIQSSDKAEFIKDFPNKASYETVGKVIFGITPSGEGA